MDTQITFVLDSSGSMQKIAADTIGGFNSFLDDQRDEEGTATVSLYNFNTIVERVYEGQDIKEAPELDDDTYSPGGQTALHDAIVTAVDESADRIVDPDEDDHPDNVIVVVLTDGKENASETPQETVHERVEQYREGHGWEFLFIGANQDAALTAESIGMDADKSLDMAHTDEGTQAAYSSTSESVSRARQEGSTGGYDDNDRRRQDDVSE